MTAEAGKSAGARSIGLAPRRVHAAGRPLKRRYRGLTGLAIGALLLSGCGSDDEASPRAGSERLAGAAEAGMERASSYGFDSAGFVTEDALEQFREQSADSAAGAETEEASDVTPEQCAEPLAAVDWAPLMLGGDAARVDFGTEGFAGTGSIEVAEAAGEDAEARVEEHLANIDALLEDCPEVAFTAEGEELELEVTDLEPGDGEAGDAGPGGDAATTAYSWQRDAAGSAGADPASDSAEADGTTVAQILLTQQGDDVVMVSFIGDGAAGSPEFTQMAEGITEATLEALDPDDE